MKKFLMTLVVAVFAVGAMSAQVSKTATQQVVIEKKHECKDHKDGKPCTKPADQQCDDCKAKAAAAQKHECKQEAGKKCEKTATEMMDCCKDKKMEGKQCDKPADQQCPDCKEQAAKKNCCDSTF